MPRTIQTHTPGPYFVAHTKGPFAVSTPSFAIFNEDGELIAVVPGTEEDENAKKDAILLAAAPTLLDAVEAYHEALDAALARIAQLDPDFSIVKSRMWPAMENGLAAKQRALGIGTDWKARRTE